MMYLGSNPISVNNTYYDSSIIAPDYSELVFPIQQGQGCIYNKEYYIAKQNIVTNEEWTSAHWEKVTISSALSQKYEKPQTGIPASDLESGVIPEVPVQDVQVNGTSVLSQGVANIPLTGNGVTGTVKLGAGTYGLVVDGNERLVLNVATDAQIKGSDSAYRPIVPNKQNASTFYGLAKASGDNTQSASSNPVGTYTEEAKTSINNMIGSVSKDSLDNAGITARSYTTKFGGEFSVTTVASQDYISPYARANVTGRLYPQYKYNVTFDGTEYIVPGRLVYITGRSDGDGSCEYIGSIDLYRSDTSGIIDKVTGLPFCIISCMDNSSENHIDVFTQTAGTHTILIKQIDYTKTALPEELIWGENFPAIRKAVLSGSAYSGYSIGNNELKNKRATFAMGYGNTINAEFSHAIGDSNEIINRGYSFGSKNTINSGSAFGYNNTTNGGYTFGKGNVSNQGMSFGEQLIDKIGAVVVGQYNVEIQDANYPDWEPNTLYHINDCVFTVSPFPNKMILKCITEHTSSGVITNDILNWKILIRTTDTSFLVGIGGADGDAKRRNGLKIDTEGHSHFAGNIYVNCNDDSSGGTMLPTDVQVNGTSIISSGVANIPTATSEILGVIKPSSGLLANSSGAISIYKATDAQVKAGVHQYNPIVPSTQHQSVFYGLATASGDTTQKNSNNSVGTYTESAKSAISQMLNAPETVSGSTPSITAKAGVRYICGEVSTLTIIVPSSGIIDVTFESGSTPTVLTITPPTGVTINYPAWFNPSSLVANTTYEINIADGKNAVVMAWA